MTTFKRQITGVVATGLLVASLLSPAASLADTNLTETGNGAFSQNGVTVSQQNNTTVVQNNDANVTTHVDASSNTGGNTSSLNTGGNVLVKTGDAGTGVTVTNDLNKNTAAVSGCNCLPTDTTVKLDGNGAYSSNGVTLNQDSTNGVYQDNNAHVDNNIDAKAKTGANTASLNTGGDTQIITGAATSITDVTTHANANAAMIGGNGAGAGNGGSLSAIISGNGAFSLNGVELDMSKNNLIAQDNYAHIYNNVDAAAKTGENDTTLNTGGNVLIHTGAAQSVANVDNRVNFNWADVDCGCLTDVTAKIAGNGVYSDNGLSALLGGDTQVFQGQEGNGNNAYLMNYVDAHSKTGLNDSELNVGPVVGDPNWTITGDATTLTGVNNAGNVNVFGSMMPLTWPNMGVDFGFWL